MHMSQYSVMHSCDNKLLVFDQNILNQHKNS